MTILGFPTVAELRDLVSAKDAELSSLNKQYQGFKPAWDSKDKTASAAWATDYQALKTRYNVARVDAQAIINSSNSVSVPPSVVPASDEWLAVLTALKIPGTTQSAIGELYKRLIDAGATSVKYLVPQPLPGSDADINFYKKSGEVLEALDPELVGKHGTSTLEKGVIALAVIAGVGVVGYTAAQMNMLIPRRR